ncbi:MAG: hypothetical protein IKZ61_11895 [Prevotella sp.]|nr:hypothetical protein [Prevotella sp.]
MEYSEAKMKLVYGNTRNAAIILKELVDIETGETAPFDVQEGDEVTVNIKEGHNSNWYTPKIEGNVLSFRIGTELTVGDYEVEVGVVRGEDTYVSRKRWQLSVVRYDDEAGIPADAEFSSEDLEMIANMYIKGDPMTYDDMTEGQKADLASHLAGNFSVDDDGYLIFENNEP